MIAAGRALAAAVLLLSAAGTAPAAEANKPILDSAIKLWEHTDREFAVVDSMVPRFYLLTRMIMELGKGPKEP